MRVLVIDMPEILRGIIEDAIASEPDMQLVRPRWRMAAGGEPDVVIVGTPRAEDVDGAEAMLARWPRSRVLMVATSGRHTVMYELRPSRTELGELSPADLVAAVRSMDRPHADLTHGDGGGR